ncbi:Protein-N(pi)-phosphohistidine--sugar phosphotransferase [Clostridium sp. DL-VIII]|uniref:PTS transporter subunit EIIC n=1 Tax=Clostridium sp. DL-VIII TaxID=641107 RepID=UPI00023B00C8|nr:PTS transporter subunit EIIC [Clostridium sp. DL-VIII]EHI99177.1 Protein-N(pi)-phosphohistidine--sugar phosphotransferase [Clostridium sp. DL-VIII]
MNYEITAIEIIANIGGKENVLNVTHCATRLRFNLKDENLVKVKDIKKIQGVINTANKGGQFQIIIGPEVNELYEEVAKICVITEEEKQEKKKNVINSTLDSISGIFVSIIPVLIAAGMTSAILALLTTFNLVSTESSTYLIISSIQGAIFNFLPLFVGYAAGVKFKCNPFMGMALGAVLCYSKISSVEGLNFLGISIRAITYTSSVFPVILGVWAMSYIEKYLTKFTPKMLRGFFVPMMTIIIIVPLTLIVFGPIGAMLGDLLASLITILNGKIGWLSPVLIAALYPFMILTGMHYSLLPLVMTSFSTFGFDSVLMVAGFLSNMCEGAVSLAIAIKTKNKDLKTVAFSTGFSAIMGISEPALFGITLRFKKTLFVVSIGGVCGALFAGLMSLKAYGFVGGLPSLPLFISPNGWGNLEVCIASIIISFSVTFILTYLFGFKDAKEEKNEE